MPCVARPSRQRSASHRFRGDTARVPFHAHPCWLDAYPLLPVRVLDLCPAVSRHELCPAPVELAMVALAEPVVAGPGSQVFVEALMPEPHLHVQRQAPGHRPPTGAGALLPVVHVVLLEGPRGAEAAHTRQTKSLLHLRRGSLIDIDPRPELNRVGPTRVPDAEGP